MAAVLRYAARSDVGLIREGNEDSGYAGPALLLVADGMGGHAAGELASAIAVATVADLDVHPPAEGEVLRALGQSVAEVGTRIASVIDAEPDLTGMGTTVTGLYWLGDRIAVLHIGDSRAYLLRENVLIQLTHDHTYVQTLVDAGRITEDEAMIHPRRSLLMRAVDGVNAVEADLFVREAQVGDRYLLCTDGLSGVVDRTVMASILGTFDPTGAVTALVDLALERGAPDNVTVVVADVVAPTDPAADDPAGHRLIGPVVVGAAGEPRVRSRLPTIRFPHDAQPDPDRPDAPPPPADPGPPTQPQPLIDADLVVPGAQRARGDSDGAQRADGGARRRRRRRWLVAIGTVVGLLLVFLAATQAARAWVGNQWYVAVNGSAGTGTVAVYQGVSTSLLGVPLSSLYADTDLQVGTLPLFDQENVSKGISASSHADAERIIATLRERAAQCQATPPSPGCPGAVP